MLAGSASFVRFAPQLLRPFLDLGTVRHGPLYSRAIEHYWCAFADASLPPFALQRTLPAAFRMQVHADAGLVEVPVNDPRQLPESLHSARWGKMCEALDHWNDLTEDRRVRLSLLLHSLCYYAPVVTLVPDIDDGRLRDDPEYLELVYWRESAKYMLGLQGPVTEYKGADLLPFERIASSVLVESPAVFNAAVKLFVHKAKVGAPVAELERHADRMKRALAASEKSTNDFDAGLRRSRFYRALAFLPMRTGRRDDMVRLMEKAECRARELKPVSELQQMLYSENLHPVLESRTKEALWLGDTALAVERAKAVVDLDPYDPKSWIELGHVRMKRGEWVEAAEAHIVAATLGPPAAAIGRHLAGICLRKAGQPNLASFFFKDALEVDPRGISPREALQDSPDTAIAMALKQWSLGSFAL